VELLLAAKALVDAADTQAGATALFLAAEHGCLANLQRLLAAGADVHRASRYGTACTVAADLGHAACVVALLAAKAAPPAEVCAGASMPVELQSSKHAAHAVRKVRTEELPQYAENGFSCDVCAGCSKGLMYHCDACGWDAHPRCARGDELG
jgi:hypothetical protein